MSFADLIPSLKGHGRRRAVDEVDRLRENEVILLRDLHAAGDAIAILRQDLADAHAKQAEAEELVVQLQADADDLTVERDGLAEELAALKHRFAAQLAADANAHRITVPPMQRDTSDPADQATQPIPVMQLQKAAAAGLLGPVLDPGHP